jgi:hypothetical protein
MAKVTDKKTSSEYEVLEVEGMVGILTDRIRQHEADLFNQGMNLKVGQRLARSPMTKQAGAQMIAAANQQIRQLRAAVSVLTEELRPLMALAERQAAKEGKSDTSTEVG